MQTGRAVCSSTTAFECFARNLKTRNTKRPSKRVEQMRNLLKKDRVAEAFPLKLINASNALELPHYPLHASVRRIKQRQ